MLFLLLLIALPLAALGDTVEFIRGGTVNGTVVYQNEKFTIQAVFEQGGKREIVIERKFVASIEINDKATNTGAPPANFGVFAANDAERFEMGTVDVLRLNDGDRPRGRLEAITATALQFNGEQVPRAEVRDVLLGSAVLYR